MDPKDCSAAVDDLTEAQMKTVGDWEEKFSKKYAEVGKVWPHDCQGTVTLAIAR